MIGSTWKLLLGGVGALILYAFFRPAFEQQAATQIVAGWDGISDCSFMASFDGKRHLSLSENHFARMEESDQASTDGSWSYDEDTGKYTITVNGEPITYSVVDPGDGGN